MDVAPPKTPAAPKAPIPVEESRAKRLQRQQARFRDRGGIFVPSNRNTLIGILLDRKSAQSPRKSRGRSLSRSPLKPKPKKFPVQSNSAATTTPTDYVLNRRMSPRKITQELQPHDDNEGNTEAVAGPSRLPEDNQRKAVKKPVKKPTTSRKTTSRKAKVKADASETENPAPKRRGRPPRTKALDDQNEVTVDAVAEAQPKPKSRRATRASAKHTVKKPKDQAPSTAIDPGQTIPEVTRDANVIDPGSKQQGKVKAKTTAPSFVNTPEAQALSTTLISGPPKKSATSQSKPNLKLDAHASGLVPAEKRSTRMPARKDKGVRVDPQDDVPAIRNAKDTAIRKPRESNADHGEQPRTDRKGKAHQADTSTEEPTKLSRKRTRVLDSDPALDEPTTESPDDIVQDTRKRPKIPPEIEKSPPLRKKQANAKTSKEKVERKFSEDEVPLMEKIASTSKKRPRDPGLEKQVEPRPMKVPRKSPEVPVVQNKPVVPPDMDEAENRDPAAKKIETERKTRAKKAPKTNSAPKSSSSRVKPTVSSTAPPRNMPKPKIKPRKSVMQRIKEPLPQIEDDDPDPIDFLS